MQLINRPEEISFIGVQGGVFIEDIKIIENYSLDQLNAYINSAIQSIVRLEKKEDVDIHWMAKAKHEEMMLRDPSLPTFEVICMEQVEKLYALKNEIEKELLNTPYTIYCKEDPAAQHGRFSILPVNNDFKDFIDGESRLINSHVKAYYDFEHDDILEDLNTLVSHMLVAKAKIEYVDKLTDDLNSKDVPVKKKKLKL